MKDDETRTVYLDDGRIETFNQQWESRKIGKKLLPYIFLDRMIVNGLTGLINPGRALAKKLELV